jgi:hypothetical protein
MRRDFACWRLVEVVLGKDLDLWRGRCEKDRRPQVISLDAFGLTLNAA